jgi:hypothetical protein
MDDLIRRLDKVGSRQPIKTAMRAAAQHVKGKVNVYPPDTIANSPSNPSGRWYERNYGPRWRRRDGSIGGSPTSKQLKHKWTTKLANDGLSAIVGNNVSYGPYVQDEERQAGFHRRRGWKTIQDVSREEAETVARFVRDHVERALEGK